MDKRLLKVGEAAEWASIGRSTAYELVKSGEWPSIRIGRTVRVPLVGLERWMRANLFTDEDEEGNLRVNRR